MSFRPFRLSLTALLLATVGLAAPAAAERPQPKDEPSLGPSDAERERAQRDYDKAVRLVRANKPRDALELFEHALPVKNDTSDIFYNLVQVCEALKRWDKVLAYAQGFLVLESQTSDARAIRGKLDVAKKRLEAGEQAPIALRIEAPEGAEAYIDDVPVSLDGPGEAWVLPGRHTVGARKAEHIPWNSTVVVAADEAPAPVTPNLVKLVYKGLVKVVTEPAEGVQVYVDDRLQGTTPLDPFPLPTERFLIRLEKPGYDTWVRYVTPVRDETYELKASLEATRPGRGDR